MLGMFVYRAGEWGCSRGGWGQSMTSVERQSTEQGQDPGKADLRCMPPLILHPRCLTLPTLVSALTEPRAQITARPELAVSHAGLWILVRTQSTVKLVDEAVTSAISKVSTGSCCLQ